MAKTRRQPKTEDAPKAEKLTPASPSSEAQGLESLPRFTRSQEYRAIYCDIYRARLGNGDIGIVFSRTSHEPGLDVGTSVIEEQAEIVISWGLAKVLTSHLVTLVAAVEEEIGGIQTPVGLTFSIERQRETVRSLGLTSSAATTPAFEPAGTEPET
jgi:hypothetical protein